jgi:hypothetical protein
LNWGIVEFFVQSLMTGIHVVDLSRAPKPMRRKHALRSTTSRLLRRSLEVLLEDTLVLPLLCRCLVSTVTELGRGVDPLELDLLERPPAGVGEHGLAQGHDALLDTRAVTLEENEVVLDLTVADEATHAGTC